MADRGISASRFSDSRAPGKIRFGCHVQHHRCRTAGRRQRAQELPRWRRSPDPRPRHSEYSQCQPLPHPLGRTACALLLWAPHSSDRNRSSARISSIDRKQRSATVGYHLDRAGNSRRLGEHRNLSTSPSFRPRRSVFTTHTARPILGDDLARGFEKTRQGRPHRRWCRRLGARLRQDPRRLTGTLAPHPRRNRPATRRNRAPPGKGRTHRQPCGHFRRKNSGQFQLHRRT